MTPTEEEQNCVFCKILKGELAVSTIYEDDLIIVIVDLYPVNKGHLLVIPKVHAAYISDVSNETLSHMMILAKKMNKALRVFFNCDGVNLFLADGVAAGQEIFHSHLHVYPRFNDDGFGFSYDTRHFQQLTRKEMDEIAEALKSMT